MEIAGEEFGFILEMQDLGGNKVLDFNGNFKIQWNWISGKSWTGQDPSLPDRNEPLECEFIAGQCLTEETYVIKNADQPTYIWVGDGEGGLEDVAKFPILVNRNVPAGVVPASASGGPVYQTIADPDDVNATIEHNVGAIVYSTFSIDTEAPYIEFYAAEIDKAGNYIKTYAGNDVLWEDNPDKEVGVAPRRTCQQWNRVRAAGSTQRPGGRGPLCGVPILQAIQQELELILGAALLVTDGLNLSKVLVGSWVAATSQCRDHQKESKGRRPALSTHLDPPLAGNPRLLFGFPLAG